MTSLCVPRVSLMWVLYTVQTCLMWVREVTRWNRNSVDGLPCIVIVDWKHNHDTTSAAALRHHTADQQIKDTFTAYFNDGMNPAAAMKYHRDWLEMDAAFCEQDLADARKNPLPRSVYEWHDQWRKLNLGDCFYQH